MYSMSNSESQLSISRYEGLVVWSEVDISVEGIDPEKSETGSSPGQTVVLPFLEYLENKSIPTCVSSKYFPGVPIHPYQFWIM